MWHPLRLNYRTVFHLSEGSWWGLTGTFRDNILKWYSTRSLKRLSGAWSGVWRRPLAFFGQQTLELILMVIQGSFKHSAAVGLLRGFSSIIRSMRQSAGSLLTGTVFTLCDNVPEEHPERAPAKSSLMTIYQQHWCTCAAGLKRLCSLLCPSASGVAPPF